MESSGRRSGFDVLGADRSELAKLRGHHQALIAGVPVRSNFREGMTVLEYFISTHGVRPIGMAGAPIQ
ncbi:MAG: hypothetical protein ABI452_06765 [Candidatus Limnocylindrales bacterium]